MPRLTRAAALLATAFALVVACGPGAGAGSTAPSSAPSVAPSTEPSAPASVEPSLSPGASEGGGVVYIVNVVEDPTLGDYLTGEDGMTLYIFTADSPDTSTCASGCVENWPPFTIGSSGIEAGPGVTGELDTITRADGTIQVTYDHQPLYYYVGDTAEGDTNGQDMGGVWFVAPAGESGSASPSPSAGKGDY